MRICWPSEGDPRDPFPEPDRSEEAWAAEVRARLADLWAGRASEDEIVPLVRQHRLDRPLGRRHRPLPRAEFLATEAELVQLAADADPAVGSSGPDLVLGPMADLVTSRRVLEVAVALAAFFRGDAAVGTPQRRWHRIHPAPSVPVRASVTAIAQAPLAPWRVMRWPASDEVLPSIEVQDVLGLSEVVVPDGPVSLRAVAAPFGSVGPRDLLVARIARGPNGWEATCPLAIPGPVPEAVPRWIQWLCWEDRLERRGPTSLSGLLSRWGHVLVRRWVEQRWAT
ncbi:MAG: hypothetical protein KTR31_26860 [Myxococcales bacterium]|nr:hypothetical protein [Myxococcales bacterium]